MGIQAISNRDFHGLGRSCGPRLCERSPIESSMGRGVLVGDGINVQLVRYFAINDVIRCRI